MVIPKIVHRMWLDKNVDDNITYPAKYNKFTKSFDNFNPEFRMMFWNMNRINNFFDTHPEIAKYKIVFQNMPYHIQKCDMARYAILYIYGGVYIDLDFVFYKNLSPLLDRQLLLVLEPSIYAENYHVNGILSNALIGSVPRHPFWLEWMDFIIESMHNIKNGVVHVKRNKNISNNHIYNVLYTTGPINFKIFLDQSRYSNVDLADTCDIMPIYFDGRNHFITKECTYRNNGSQVIPANYYQKINNYCDTKWSEGSGWGKETLEAYTQPKNDNNLLGLFLLILIIVLIACIFYVFGLINKN